MNDEFEQRLSKTPLREIPASWREEILGAAHEDHRRNPGAFGVLVTGKFVTMVGTAGPAVPKIGLRNLKLMMRNALWPHPFAWGALAALWLAILSLNHSGPHEDRLYASKMPAQDNTDEARALIARSWRQHDRCIAMLNAQTITPPSTFLDRSEL